jgi:hypothetical protein
MFSIRVSPLKWAEVPSLPPGAKIAVIEGPLAEAVPFTFRLKFPADYKVPAHWHPAIEHVTVISGTFHMGTGDKLDAAKTKPLSRQRGHHAAQDEPLRLDERDDRPGARVGPGPSHTSIRGRSPEEMTRPLCRRRPNMTELPVACTRNATSPNAATVFERSASAGRARWLSIWPALSPGQASQLFELSARKSVLPVSALQLTEPGGGPSGSN